MGKIKVIKGRNEKIKVIAKSDKKEKKIKAQEEAESEARKQAMREMLYAEAVAFHTKVPDKYKKQINYVTQKEGLFEVRVNSIGQFITKANKAIGGEDKIKGDGFIYDLSRKIPLEVLQHIIDFYKLVNTTYGSEAYNQVYWDKENRKFLIYYPKQDCSGGHVDYERSKELEEKYLLVMDIHSHNTMGAFFSGMDDSDEKENRLFGVVGEITKEIPAMKFRISSNGKHIGVKPSDIFDLENIGTSRKLKSLAKELEDMAAASGESTNGVTTTATTTNYGSRRTVGHRTIGFDYARNCDGAKDDILDNINDDQVVVVDPDDVDEIFSQVIMKCGDEKIEGIVDLLIEQGFGSMISERIKLLGLDNTNKTFLESDYADAEGNNMQWD